MLFFFVCLFLKSAIVNLKFIPSEIFTIITRFAICVWLLLCLYIRFETYGTLSY